jgi:hypothetical protein
MEIESLKVKSIEAESIVVKCPGSTASISIAATPSATGIWLNAGGKSYVGLVCDNLMVPYFVASTGEQSFPNIAIIPADDGDAVIQLGKGNTSDVVRVKASELAKIVNAAGKE